MTAARRVPQRLEWKYSHRGPRHMLHNPREIVRRPEHHKKKRAGDCSVNRCACACDLMHLPPGRFCVDLRQPESFVRVRPSMQRNLNHTPVTEWCNFTPLNFLTIRNDPAPLFS